MANGKVHDRVTIFLSLPLSFLLQKIFDFKIKETSLFFIGFLFAGLMFGPDLDTKSNQYKRWGPLRFIWKPYQKLGGHRSFLNQSHDSFFGPLIRIIYLFFMLLFLISIVFFVFQLFEKYLFKSEIFNLEKIDFNLSIKTNTWKKVLISLLGIWLGSLSHHLTDWLWEIKRFCLKKLKLINFR